MQFLDADLRERLERDPRLLEDHLAAPSLVARAVALAARLGAASSPILAVVAEQSEAERLHEILRAFIGDAARLLEPWDILPFEPASLEPAAAADRVETLTALIEGRPMISVASVRAVARRTLSPGLWRAASRRLAILDEVPPSALKAWLVAAGYSPSAEVSAPGEFAARGGILDLFPPGLASPVRIEWDGDLIESLRLFDPASQRSIAEREEIVIHPPRELIVPSSVEERSAAADRVRAAIRPSIRRDRFIEAIEAGEMIEGLELLLPFLGETSPITGLGPMSLVLIDEDRIAERFAEIRAEAEREAEVSDLGYDPNLLWLSGLDDRTAESALEEAITFHILSEPREGLPAIETEPLPPSPLDARVLRVDVGRLVARGDRVIVVSTMGDRVRELLRQDGVRAEDVSIVAGRIESGAILPDAGIAVVGDLDLFGHAQRRARKGRGRRAVADWGALRDGDYVVHLHHGIGRFRGIERIRTLGEERDVVVIEYADDGRIYLPPHETNLIERYTVLEGVTPHLDRLGGPGWARIREKAEREAAEVARELLDLYALRAAADGIAYDASAEEEAFADAFGYDETDDQQAAIEATLRDLEKSEERLPMDRLVCGDVGFGKTEVALRAAFRVVRSGRQVGVLCPTTILALQHTETFRARLAPFGIRVATLSRFQSAAETRETLAALAAGTCSIVVGTHALIGDRVRWRDLGLVVVDEEQRFGVRHKEKLKNLRRRVDVLTLSATPIPRTLHLALSGARGLSLIETPPEGRTPIQTIVEPFNEEHLRRAIRRELDRDGQIFYVHNRIESIDRVRDFLSRLFPKVPMAVAHGRMDEKDLSKTMHDFLAGRVRILLSTSIVENGLDIPRANTLIIDQAERFGLAQLYQLRGRVGRSRTRAYAYFFYSAGEPLTEVARARLAAIAEHTALGAGYVIARRDMEIRGAGEILGLSQHGQMEAVGYDMYCRLLKEAVAELKGEVLKRRKKPPVVDLALPAFIPPGWLGGEELIGAIHREIAGVGTVAEVERLREGLIDRFGPLPRPVENLLELARLRAYAELDGVEAIVENEYELRITWRRLPEGIERFLALLPTPLSVRFIDRTAIIEGFRGAAERHEWVKKILRR
jgi:transcription-repair coupling factor (superfamily II helicase)